jgi:hypothetical protein
MNKVKKWQASGRNVRVTFKTKDGFVDTTSVFAKTAGQAIQSVKREHGSEIKILGTA